MDPCTSTTKMTAEYTGWNISKNPPEFIKGEVGKPTKISKDYQGKRLEKNIIQKETMVQLKDKYKRLGIPISGNKKDLVERLYKKTNPDLFKDDFEFKEYQLTEFLKTKKKGPRPLPFVYYKENFNLVDRLDRYWYQYLWDAHRRQNNWESYFMWCLLDIGLLNSWAIWRDLLEEVENMDDFILNLCKEILDI